MTVTITPAEKERRTKAYLSSITLRPVERGIQDGVIHKLAAIASLNIHTQDASMQTRLQGVLSIITQMALLRDGEELVACDRETIDHKMALRILIKAARSPEIATDMMHSIYLHSFYARHLCSRNNGTDIALRPE